jgi:peptide/nickel transport system ATP-binding protein
VPPEDTLTASVASVRGLELTFERDFEPVHALRGVDLEIGEGEIVGIVGESGSGKTVLGLSLLGLLPESDLVARSGSVEVAGVDLFDAPRTAKRELAHHSLGAVFQDPMTSLDPTMRVGRQVREAAGPEDEVEQLLASVGIPDPALRQRAFPHELSGGLRQRVMISMAIAGEPRLVVADEPTTALDVTVQSQILDVLRSMRERLGCAIVIITHDLGVAAELADRIVVLYGGRVAETGPTAEVLASPRHPYTAALLRSRFDLRADRQRPLATIEGEPPSPTDLPGGCPFSPRCAFSRPECDEQLPPLVPNRPDAADACLRSDEIDPKAQLEPRPPWDAPTTPTAGSDPLLRVRGLEVELTSGWRSRRRAQILRGVDLDLGAGESLALVGESGCGKTTLLRAIAGLRPPTAGEIELAGEAQMVFQDPGSSLTPWLSVGEHLEDRLRGRDLDAAERRGMVADALRMVGLPERVASVRPARLSGGQRQRVALARAIVRPPELLLCDEPTSALDVSVASSVLNLIGDLRRRLGMAVLFVTHDLAAARLAADRIAVMYLGRVIEVGPADEVISSPRHPYTRALIAAIPNVTARDRREAKGEPPSIYAPPPGCSFHPRCREALPECAARPPHLVEAAPHHLADCIQVER